MGMADTALSAKYQREFNREQRAWQERMSNTAYQRQTKDLEAAGINRVLGYMKGAGASTPSGGTGSAPSSNMAGAAMKGAMISQQLKSAKAAEGRDQMQGEAAAATARHQNALAKEQEVIAEFFASGEAGKAGKIARALGGNLDIKGVLAIMALDANERNQSSARESGTNTWLQKLGLEEKNNAKNETGFTPNLTSDAPQRRPHIRGSLKGKKR